MLDFDLELAPRDALYERREIWPGIGYDDAYLREKLLAGPNAAHHAARLGARA